MPKVSVVIPTYNRRAMLAECIASVQSQSLTDFEIIVCDNMSSDDTSTWIKTVIKKDKRVKYLQTKIPLSMVDNWNRGIKKAKGKYVCLLMDDDVWDRDFLHDTSKCLDTHKGVGVVAVQPVPWYMKGAEKIYPKDHYRLFNRNKLVKGMDCIKLFLAREWRVGLPSAVLTRKKCFNQKGLFKEPGIDPEMWLRILTSYDFYYIDKKLTHWRIHTGASYTSASLTTPLKNNLILIEVMLEVYGYLSLKDLPTAKPLLQNSLNQIWFESYTIFKKLTFKQKVKSIVALWSIYKYAKTQLS